MLCNSSDSVALLKLRIYEVLEDAPPLCQVTQHVTSPLLHRPFLRRVHRYTPANISHSRRGANQQQKYATAIRVIMKSLFPIIPAGSSNCYCWIAVVGCAVMTPCTWSSVRHPTASWWMILCPSGRTWTRRRINPNKDLRKLFSSVANETIYFPKHVSILFLESTLIRTLMAVIIVTTEL